METASNVLESWAETQKKAVDNLVETSGKLGESLAKGDLLQKGTDIYKDWFNNQKNIIETTVAAAAGKPANPVVAAAQAAAAPASLPGSELFSQLLNNQMQLVKTWTEQVQQISAKAFDAPKPADTFSAPLAAAADLYQKWSAQFAQLMNGGFQQPTSFAGFTAPNWQPGNYDQLMQASKAYIKLYELYQPITQYWQQSAQPGSQAGNFPAFDAKALLSPDKFKEVIDQVFQFAAPEKFKAFYEQLSKAQSGLQAGLTAYSEKSAEQFKAFTEQFTQGGAAKFPDFGKNALSHLESAFAPLSKLLPAGKDQEQAETAAKLREKFAQYWQLYTQLQYIVYAASQKATEKVAADFAEKAKAAAAGEVQTLPKYDNFYNQWLNTTESVLISTFGGDEFSKVQADLLTSGLEIKKILERQLEGQLSGLPVVTRSQADELALQIHDLKARIRSLEKAASEAEETDEKVKKTTAKAKA